MTETATPARQPRQIRLQTEAEFLARLKQRYAAERRFRVYGIMAIGIAATFLVVLLTSVVIQGAPAFTRYLFKLEVELTAADIDPEGKADEAVLRQADYQGLVRRALQLRFPDATARADKKLLNDLISSGAADALREAVLADPRAVGTRLTIWAPVSDPVSSLLKGHVLRETPEADRKIKDKQIDWVDQLVATGEIKPSFNADFFTQADSRQPELAGILGALVGSIYTMMVTLLVAFPVAVAAAVYLEEFAPKNRWTDLIEVNINNLAAVPSIVFGLLGLAVFIQFAGLPRSAPVVGGLTLALQTLPTIIIAARAALKAVPPSIRQAALGVGASPLQVVAHHVLPLAVPGILTGTIIGMAHALGETAPLLMIGMVSFIVAVPGGPLDPATALPVQIFMWADSPERGFAEKTAAAILVLLGFLMLMNLLAIILRKRFERRW